MSVKKRIKPGKIEPSADGHSIVVHFTTETTHLDEDGLPCGTEKAPDKREVNVAKHLRGLREQDIPAFAQEIVEKCRYIPATKQRQVEQVLAKLCAASLPHDGWGDCHGGHGTTARGSLRVSDDFPGRASPSVEDARHVADALPEANIANMDDYAEELYEEKMEAKTLGAQRLLRICTESRMLARFSEHSTLLGVLSRELRENAKRSHELTVAITGIFLCLAHFSQFHPVLVRHQCNDVTMRVVEYESRRRTVLTKELDLTRGRMLALGSQASREDHDKLKIEEHRYRNVLDRQDRLLQLCLLVLRNLAEDVTVEKMLVGRRICHFLIRLLDRSDEDLLQVTLAFLHKLAAFEENKDQLVQQSDCLKRLAELAAHSSSGVALLALRVCFNVSFDPRARHVFISQTSMLATLVAAAKRQPLRKVALKLLYHLTMDGSARAAIAERSLDCITLGLQLVVSGSEQRVDKDAVAICVNLAAHEACAQAIVEQDTFPRLAVRAVQFADPLLLKVLRLLTFHSTVRSRLLEVLAADKHGGATWLHELVVLSTISSAGPETLVESLGILANLECQSPEVPWPDLVQAGLLDLLHRLLSEDADDDVLLECIMLIGLLALEPDLPHLIAASKVPTLLPAILTEKHEDSEIILQLLFTLRCLLLQDETREALLQQTDAPDRVLDLLREASSQDIGNWQAIQASAEETLDLIVAALSDSQNGAEPWLVRIKAFRFEIHNDEWCQRMHQQERPQDVKSAASGGTDTRRSFMRWTDTNNLADRCWGDMPGYSNSRESSSLR